MPNKAGHRRFGSIRKLPSGRYQVRYPGPDGRVRSHPETFARKGDASRTLALLEGQLAHGTWTDPERGKVTLSEYAVAWIVQRPGPGPGRWSCTGDHSNATSRLTWAVFRWARSIAR